MGKYWKSVFERAWSDTTALFPFVSSPFRAWVIIFVYLVAAAILTFIAGKAQLMEEVNVIISFVAASTVIFGAIFLMNFIAAPARINQEDGEKIKKLEATLLKQSQNRVIAAPLREKITEVDRIIERQESAADSWRKSSEARQWELSVVDLMRKANLPEEDIHMFESISHIPSKIFTDYEINEALTAKRTRLRLIIASLLRRDVPFENLKE